MKRSFPIVILVLGAITVAAPASASVNGVVVHCHINEKLVVHGENLPGDHPYELEGFGTPDSGLASLLPRTVCLDDRVGSYSYYLGGSYFGQAMVPQMGQLSLGLRLSNASRNLDVTIEGTSVGGVFPVGVHGGGKLLGAGALRLETDTTPVGSSFHVWNVTGEVSFTTSGV